MKISKNTPVFLRYFSARFQPLTKPMFWCSLGGFLIAGLAVYQYWQHPNWLQTNFESVKNARAVREKDVPNVSSEDLAAAANIDNINVLLEEIEQNKTLLDIAAEGKQNQSATLKREESEFSRLQKAQKNKLNNPDVSSSYYLGEGLGNKKIMELLKPPSFSSYQTSSKDRDLNLRGIAQPKSSNIIPAPVGNIYLSNRDRKSLGITTTPNTSIDTRTNREANTKTNTEIPNNSSNLAAENDATNNLESSNGVVSPNSAQSSSQVSQPSSNSNIPPNTNNPNSFVPASSLIRTRQTPAAPVNGAITPSSTMGLNSVNSNSTNSSSPTNLYGANGNGSSNLSNPIGSSSVNRVGTNPNNGTANGNSNASGTNVTQPVQRTFVPGVTQSSNINSINREGGAFTNTGTNEGNNPNVLQNNYRSYRVNNSSYSRPAPNGYQLQPRNNLSNNNPNLSNNSSRGQSGNSSIGNGTRGLQPAGRLQTSEINR